jgi:hypothetical protein
MLFLLFAVAGSAQPVFQTFKDTRVINTHSTEVLGKGQMDIRIGHRFGDMFGDRGGWPTFYGLEQARDVLIGAEYGLTKDLMIGISRSKGAGDLKQNLNGLVKWRFIQQNEAKNFPISAAFVGIVSGSTQEANPEGTSLNTFPEFSHRFVFHSAFIVARKFNPYLSLQIGAGLTHRNLVIEGQDNDIINLSAAGRVQITKSFGLILDANFPFASQITTENGFYPALGVGFEFETGGGHVFQINVTNASGMMETDYIPYTRSNWADGEFRLGFTISRQFKI